MWERGREFVIRAGTVILAFSIIIWSLLYFPRDQALEEKTTQDFVAQAAANSSPAAVQAELDNPDSSLSLRLAHRIESAQIEQSYLGRFGHAVQPVFEPAGFDWKITVGVLASFPAREVIVSTLGVTYSVGEGAEADSKHLQRVMRDAKWTEGPRVGTPIFSLAAILALMVFFALCSQCGPTVATLAQETGGWKWAAISFVYMTALAWLMAVAVYQGVSRLA
mgnify:CR=1 FL=1